MADWLGAWAKRIEITIPPDDIDSLMTWLPVRMSISASCGIGGVDASEVFDEVVANWQKIAVTKADGITQLYVEKEKWDEIGEVAELWISKDGWEISDAANTVIYIYYDNTHADNAAFVADTGSRTEVWDGDFVRVFHLREDDSGQTIVDSTGTANATKKANAEPSQIDGQIGKGQDFDGSDDYITVPRDASIEPAKVTMEAWAYFKSNALDSHGHFIEKPYTSYANPYYSYVFRTVDSDTETPDLEAIFVKGGSYSHPACSVLLSDISAILDQWSYVVATFDEHDMYLDINGGTRTTTKEYIGFIEYYATDLYIGKARNADREFYGYMDEVRISDVARSAAWIKATYHSLSDDLLTWGSEELLPVPPVEPQYILELRSLPSVEIGKDAIVRTHTVGGGSTRVNKTVVAAEAGVVTFVEIYAAVALANCKVGIFENLGGNQLKCRTAHTIGAVTAGSIQAFSGLFLLVEAGDCIGIYYDLAGGGTLQQNQAGGGGAWYEAGDHCVAGDDTVYGFFHAGHCVSVGSPCIGKDLINILHNAYNPAWIEEVNKAPSLTFNIPADDEKAVDVVKPNEIWLRNYATGDLVEIFRIVNRRDTRRSVTSLVTPVITEGLLNQLGDEIHDYDYAATEKTVETIVDELLAIQVLTPAITKGTIEPAGDYSISAVKGDTLLRTIQNLRTASGGYIYVDTDRKFQWLDDIGEDKGQQIRLGKNLTGIERETDYTELINRLYPEGAGIGAETVMMGSEQTVLSAYSRIHTDLHAGDNTRIGERATLSNELISRLMFSLKSYGEPDGDITFTIRQLDDTLLATGVLFDAAALSATGTWYKVDFDPPVLIDEEVRMCVEYSGGDDDNSVIVGFRAGTAWFDATGEKLTRYDGAWTDLTNACMYKRGIPYIEDTDSQAAWGGIYSRVRKNAGITDAATLAIWAAEVVDEDKTPRLAYKVDMMNLFAIGAVNFEFDELELGSQVVVIDEELDIETKLRIVRIVHPDLLHPEQMQIDVTNRLRDVADVLVGLKL